MASLRTGGGLPAALIELSRIMPDLPRAMGNRWPDYEKRLAPVFRSLATADNDVDRAKIIRDLLRILSDSSVVRARLAPILAPSHARHEDFAAGDPPWSIVLSAVQLATPDHWWAVDAQPDLGIGAQPTRALRAWLLDQDTPARPGEPVVIGFQVGESTATNLLRGDVTVRPDGIPERGLATRWIVTSRDARLRLPGSSGLPDESLVTFALVIPQSGPSQTVEVVATPLAEGAVTMNVSIYVGAELYRECSLLFAAGSTADPRSTVIDDHEWVPTAHLNLRTTHEWTTPPSQVTIIIRDKSGEVEWVQEHRTARSERVFNWQVNSTLKAEIANVRSRLELFRAANTDYFDDIDPDDLASRLSDAQTYLNVAFDWTTVPEMADGRHRERWAEVAVSSDLFKLATDGALLARALFHPELISGLAALPPGCRVTVKWRNPSIQSLPWGLLYLGDPQPGVPVDPFLFVGSRFRFAYSGYETPELSKVLGGLDDAYRVGMFYWGADEDDAVGAESRWQRDQLRGSAKNLLLPKAQDARAAKAEVLACLARPSPSPAAMLYLFCHCTVGDGGNPSLRFGSVPDPEYLLDRYDLALTTKLTDSPVVFANACTTSGAEPDVGNLLERGFFGRGCRAFVGTETKVPVRLASRFARVFFAFLQREVDAQRRPMCVGEALTHARLFLWTQYRNIGGLFYSYVNEYELYLATEEEVLNLRRM